MIKETIEKQLSLAKHEEKRYRLPPFCLLLNFAYTYALFIVPSSPILRRGRKNGFVKMNHVGSRQASSLLKMRSEQMRSSTD